MGIFDKIKNKANEVHTCCCCGTEFSGLFKGRKLNDGQYACSKCKPELTSLMCQKQCMNI